MKYFAFSILFLCCTASMHAGNDDEGTKLNLWIPGFLIRTVGNIAGHDQDDDDAYMASQMLSKLGDINVCIREGKYYDRRADAKITRKLNRLQEKNYEDLVSVKSDGTTVKLSIRQNKKGKIKNVAAVIDDGNETFVYCKVHCRLSENDLQQLVAEATK